MKTINEVYDNIGQIFVEVEAFHYGDGVIATRAERMTHIDRAYNHARDALDGLEVLRSKVSPREFEEVDRPVSAAWSALRTIATKIRPMNLDLNDEFFEEVERFVQAFILEHNEQLRSVCDRLYRHKEGTVIAVEVEQAQGQRQASLTHGMAAALYWQKRGYTVTEKYAGSRICKKLKSGEHRIGKEYRRQSVLDLAAADEALAVEKAEEKTAKELGKNKKSVIYKY